MQWVDKVSENSARKVAQMTSRRSFLTRLGSYLVGVAAIPLLPVARAAGPISTDKNLLTDDSKSCDYWRYCAIDGSLCSCCGGSESSCPPGTEVSAVTWIGTCRNPHDNKNYIISYNDCCGKSTCSRCFCNRNEGATPVYRPFRNNDTVWCLGTETSIYNCSTAVVIGVATEN